jgi:hypothetical protein
MIEFLIFLACFAMLPQGGKTVLSLPQLSLLPDLVPDLDIYGLNGRSPWGS